MRKIYVAGPMTGLPDFNFPAFMAAAKELCVVWKVVNPAIHDLETGMVEQIGATFKTTKKFDLASALLWDLQQVAECDAIYLLDGWESSRGVAAELSLAKALGKQILYQTTPTALSRDVPGEVRVTSSTGGEKGSKQQRYDLIPVEPLRQLATLYGRGASKYDDNNWRRGYDWKLSYAALQRHLNLFWAGEDEDAEMGLPHVISAAWHCFTLAQFMVEHPEFDSRVR